MCFFTPWTNEEREKYRETHLLLEKIRAAGGFVESDEHIPRAPAFVWEKGEDPHDRCPRCKWPLENGHLCPTEV